MNKNKQIAYCGINCTECKNYRQNANCKSCREEELLIDDCTTKKCCVKKDIDFCSECKIFPCEQMQVFYKSNAFRQKGYQILLEMINTK